MIHNVICILSRTHTYSYLLGMYIFVFILKKNHTLYCDICRRWQISELLWWSRVPRVWYNEYPSLGLWRGVCTYTMITIKKEIYRWLKSLFRSQNFNVYFWYKYKYKYKYDYCQYKFINMFKGVSVIKKTTLTDMANEYWLKDNNYICSHPSITFARGNPRDQNLFRIFYLP